MAEKKHESSGFTVTDKRLFTSDGDLRVESPETEAPQPAPLVEPAASTANADVSPINAGDANALHDMPPARTAGAREAPPEPPARGLSPQHSLRTPHVLRGSY